MTNEAGLEFGTEKLLPCPFCGNEPDWKRWEVKNIWQIKIFCDGPGCHVYPSIFGNEETMTKIWNTRATPQPIDAWRPIETYDYEKFPQVILAGFITPSEYAQSNGSKPFWEISIGRCWHVNTRKFTGFLGQQPTHWMPLPKPPEGR